MGMSATPADQNRVCRGPRWDVCVPWEMQQHQMRGHSGVTMRKSFVSGVGGRGSGVSPKSPRSQRHRRHWEKRFATNDTKGHKGSDLVMGKAKPGAFTA